MSRILFLVSHLASGSTGLVHILNGNERIQMMTSNIIYENVNDLNILKTQRHKLNNVAAIYGDHLLFNTSLNNKSLYNCAKFIFCIRPGAATINELVSKHDVAPESALNYYCFRLRRIYEMAYQMPQAVLVTWDDLASGKELRQIEEYLDLNTPLCPNPELFEGKIEDIAPFPIRQQAEDYYEKYFYLFNCLNTTDSPQKFSCFSTDKS